MVLCSLCSCVFLPTRNSIDWHMLLLFGCFYFSENNEESDKEDITPSVSSISVIVQVMTNYFGDVIGVTGSHCLDIKP